MLRTRIYRAVWTRALDDALTRCRHAQRAVYNRTVDAVAPEGGRIPAKLKRPTDPDALYGQFAEWRAANPWMAAIPLVLARPAVSQARTACAHENDADVNAARVMRARALRWLELRASTDRPTAKRTRRCGTS